ncbi:hypothetical protein [Robertmurraya kyonggiensis]|uniref:Uncharacterized protein n=1 Tax=Robertmurraya kyonggiensis TaxID=1037680 RepID=A0A4U1CXM3_9BACI|nr:hypothetical protein [Robertmurraya kyonggiensis]TKC14357.1 hypothetical protein FA727_21595 [Robertmurraya kyonggiensis]
MSKILGFSLLALMAIFFFIGKKDLGLIICYAAIFIYNADKAVIYFKDKKRLFTVMHLVLSIGFLDLFVTAF